MSVVLSEHLPLLATAPDGIQKLRGLILELAVRGKLAPQDLNDEPASELLKRIAQERTRIEAEGICRKSKALPPVGEDEQPYSLPDGWTWVRLSEIGHDWGQKTPDVDFTYVDVSAIDNARGIIDSPSVVSPVDAPSRARKIVRRGTVIYSTVRPYLLNIAVIDRDLTPAPIASTAFAVIHPLAGLSSQYIFWYLRSPVFVRFVESVQTGIAYPAINDGQFFSGVFPLPPLAEQHRIVAKVDELMALCDRLEAEQADAEAAHAKLVDSLLGTLTQSADAAELAANWQRLAEHFDTLFTTESSLDALKQTILQLAVMGKLVPQDPNDEPASELLKRIAKERARLEPGGTYKKSRATPLAGEEQQLSGWVAATLPDLCGIGGGATPSKAKSAYWGEGLPWVSPKDMKVDYIVDAQDHVTELALSETRLPRIPPGSLLIVVRGMILLHSFPVATTQVEVAINQDMKSLTPFIPELQPYLALALRGWKPQILALVDRSTHGTCKLQSEKLFAFQFGIPPLAEQHRIVGKVDELISLCDRLKADLAESCRRQERLASTLIESALKAA